jgi:hypothetical protein
MFTFLVDPGKIAQFWRFFKANPPPAGSEEKKFPFYRSAFAVSFCGHG